MMPQIPALGRAVGASLIALILAGNLPATAQTVQKRGGNLTYAYISGPGTLDPQMTGNLVEMEVIHHIFEGLVAMDETYQAKPMIAEKIDVSDDAKIFTFKLRNGITFHNGKKMTSADVLATYERYGKISTNNAILANVEGYDTPDPLTFVIRLKTPNPVFLEQLKTPTYPLGIMPAEQKDKPAREADVIGTGPYRLGEWVRDSHLVIQRFDGYAQNTNYTGVDGYAGKRTAYLDSVRYNFVPEANARLAALQAGDADVIGDVLVDLASRLKGRADLTTQEVFPYCQHVIVLHSQNAPTNNVLIRRAIQAAADTEELALSTGQIFRLNPSLTYAESPYNPGDVVKKYYQIGNPALAKDLLKQAGYKGEKIVIQTNANYAYMKNSMLALAEQLKAVGVNVEVQVLDWVTNSNNMQKGTGGWNVSTTGFCSQPLLGPQQWRPMIYNFSSIKGDTKLDNAYDRFFSSPKLADRQAAWKEAETHVLEDAYFIKVSDMGQIRAFNKKVVGLRPYYLVRFWDVSLN
jgi:peptide/nickel transport system substrate-binding protein